MLVQKYPTRRTTLYRTQTGPHILSSVNLCLVYRAPSAADAEIQPKNNSIRQICLAIRQTCQLTASAQLYETPSPDVPLSLQSESKSVRQEKEKDKPTKVM